MKKIILTLFIIMMSGMLFACGEKTEETEQLGNIILFEHIDGYGHAQERVAYLLFEYKVRDYVKYQIAYVACTCRSPEVNFWKVAYVEIGLTNHEIRTISFDADGTGKYTAGFWGDSDPIPPYGDIDAPKSQWRTLDDFEESFIPWLEGKTLDDLDGISVFTNGTYPGNVKNTKQIEEQNLVDFYAGASVTTNNMIRSMKALLQYHNDKHNN